MKVFNLPRRYIEVPIFLLCLVHGLEESLFTNMIIYQTCYVSLGYNRSECALLGSHNKSNMTDDLEKIVQPYTTYITLTHKVLSTVSYAVLNLFVGPWSDKFGRKPILISSLFGFMLKHIIITTINLIGNVSPWFYILSSIPSLCLGGDGSFMTLTILFIFDITTEENRGLRFTLYDTVKRVGILLGTISSSYLLAVVDYKGVYATCTAFVCMALLYIVFLIPETIENTKKKGYFKELLSPSNITDLIDTTFKKRENHIRTLVLLCFLLMFIFMFCWYGDDEVEQLYLRRSFGWSFRKFTLYGAVHSIVQSVGALLGIYIFNKLFQMHETTILFIGFFPLVISPFLRALGTKNLHIYIAAAVECFRGVISPMIKSFISKLILKEEVGKIFSIYITVIIIARLIASPVYSMVYNQTVHAAPGVYNYITASFLMLAVFLTLIVYFMDKLPKLSNNVADESKVQKEHKLECQLEGEGKDASQNQNE